MMAVAAEEQTAVRFDEAWSGSDAADTGRVYVLLPVHNRRVLTEQFVRCLVAQSFRHFKLVLIDDGSTDGTAEMTRGYLPETVVLRGNGDWWWAGSLQQGIDWLSRENVDGDALVLMINDDLTFGPDYLARAVRLMADKPRTFLLSQFDGGVDGKAEENGTHADLQRLQFSVASSPDQINCLSTQGLFARWAEVQAVGPFHPRLLPHYLSDYEYTIRAHRKGYRLETSAELLIDLNRDSTGYHEIREKNFIVFLKKYFSVKSPNNPFYFSMFVLLACPKKWIIGNLFRTWNEARRRITRALKDSIRHSMNAGTIS